MSYTVVIRRNADGVVRSCHEPSAWRDEDDSELFWWSDGNMACDCNRAQMFAASAGELDPHHACTSDAYTVVRFELPDGRVIDPGEASA